MFVDTVSGDLSALLTTPRNRIFLHRAEASHLLRLSVFFRKPRKRRFSSEGEARNGEQGRMTCELCFYSVRLRVVCVFRGYLYTSKEFHHRKPSSSGFRSVVKIEYMQETPRNKYYAGDLTKDGAANSCNEAQVFDLGGTQARSACTQNKLFFKKHHVSPIGEKYSTVENPHGAGDREKRVNSLA